MIEAKRRGQPALIPFSTTSRHYSGDYDSEQDTENYEFDIEELTAPQLRKLIRKMRAGRVNSTDEEKEEDIKKSRKNAKSSLSFAKRRRAKRTALRSRKTTCQKALARRRKTTKTKTTQTRMTDGNTWKRSARAAGRAARRIRFNSQAARIADRVARSVLIDPKALGKVLKSDDILKHIETDFPAAYKRMDNGLTLAEDQVTEIYHSIFANFGDEIAKSIGLDATIRHRADRAERVRQQMRLSTQELSAKEK